MGIVKSFNIDEKGFIDLEVDKSLDLVKEIDRMRKEKNAVILSHFYQEGDIQDIADYVGDSLGLAQQAAATEANIILFAGHLLHYHFFTGQHITHQDNNTLVQSSETVTARYKFFNKQGMQIFLRHDFKRILARVTVNFLNLFLVYIHAYAGQKVIIIIRDC